MRTSTYKTNMNIKEDYIKPQMEILLIELELPMALSAIEEQYEKDDELLGRGRRGTWGNLYASPTEKTSKTWGNLQ